MAFARTVILEDAAREYLDEEERKYPRLSEVYRALEWRIARQPEAGYRIPNYTPARYLVKSLYRQPCACILTLMYRFTESEVNIEFVRVEE